MLTCYPNLNSFCPQEFCMFTEVVPCRYSVKWYSEMVLWKMKTTVKPTVADMDKKRKLPLLIVRFCLIAPIQEQTPTFLNSYPPILGYFSFKKFRNQFKSSVKNSCPPIKTDEHLFSKIAYSKFSLNIWP